MLTSPLHTSAITTASSRVSESASARLGGSAITTQRTTAQGSASDECSTVSIVLRRGGGGEGFYCVCVRLHARHGSVYSLRRGSISSECCCRPAKREARRSREKPKREARRSREKPGEAERSRREKPGEQEEQQEAMGCERKAEGRQAHSPEATLLRLRAAPELRATHAATCGGAQSSVAAAVSAAAHPRQVFIGR